MGPTGHLPLPNPSQTFQPVPLPAPVILSCMFDTEMRAQRVRQRAAPFRSRGVAGSDLPPRQAGPISPAIMPGARRRNPVAPQSDFHIELEARGKRLLSQLLADVVNGEILEVFVDVITDDISNVIFEEGGGDESWAGPLTMGIRVIVDVHC